jgi:phage repressor protein C with HTH and peptisase S24 domain
MGPLPLNRLTHTRVWTAIDALARRYSLSPSGLAKRAGLDPTSFNKSKRITGEGRRRWPTTESIAKVLEATGAVSRTSPRWLPPSRASLAARPSR